MHTRCALSYNCKVRGRTGSSAKDTDRNLLFYINKRYWSIFNQSEDFVTAVDFLTPLNKLSTKLSTGSVDRVPLWMTLSLRLGSVRAL